jgi:Arc/MetJ-type ribon-helix-helix transcriptional regulator
MLVTTETEPMKEKVSVSLDTKTIEWLDAQVTPGGQYRSRSHVIEYAINELKKRGA